ncbi:hypothetical protein IG3_06276 [Bacillus cereus HuA2-1]|uniref:Uncharacterized protein n=1 Tax=Bacillus cereus HuA2-1 TaxID=1053201 RepID=J8XVQ1_BACCE|nr:hypothetical protein IG3_06276 [Bacillus cereus HuA2-1]
MWDINRVIRFLSDSCSCVFYFNYVGYKGVELTKYLIVERRFISTMWDINVSCATMKPVRGLVLSALYGI